MAKGKVRFSDGGKGFLGRAPRPTEAQMQARKERADALEAGKARRLDTRRKVVLGGALIAAARTHPEVARMVDALVSQMTDRDKALFDGWST